MASAPANRPSLADTLARALESSPTGALPPVRVLAQRSGMSRRRVLAALQELRSRGVVEFTRGSAIRRSRQMPRPDDLRPAGPAARLHERLVEQIEAGERRTGSALPPASMVAGESRLSNRTVLDVYRRLVAEGMVRKHGRRYVVWPKPLGTTGESGAAPPVILVLQQDISVLRDLSGNTWSAPFPAAFFHEVQQYGVQLVPVLAVEGGESTLDASLPRGRAGIDRTVGAFGGRYRGALVLGQSWTYYLTDGARGHDFAPWVELLCSYRKPVVWWDACDEVGGRNSEQFLETYHEMLRRPLVQRYFRRCHPDLASAVRVAADSLTNAGHRVIAVAGGPYCGDEWARWRTGRLVSEIERRAARAVVPHLPDTFSRAERELIETPGVYANQPGLSAFRSSSQRRDDLLDNALRAASSLATKLVSFLDTERDVTAVVCLNDTVARTVGLGLDAMGLRVPNDLSVVSFDGDFARLFPCNFSSISPGFAFQGHRAFHHINDAAPARAKGGVDISVAGTITHGGTIGKPSSRRV